MHIHEIIAESEQPAQEPSDGYNLVEILNDPVGQYPHNFMTHAEGNAFLRGLCQEAADEIERLRNRIQPAQEPVAWMSKKRGDVSKAKMYFNEGEEILPLYTHPAPSWQGLSDDEIQDAWYKLYPLDKNNLWDDMMIGKHLDKFARAIEQALKEKNHV